VLPRWSAGPGLEAEGIGKSHDNLAGFSSQRHEGMLCIHLGRHTAEQFTVDAGKDLFDKG